MRKTLLFILTTLLSFALEGQITYTYGTYTGGGPARVFSGLGFAPAALMVKSAGAYQANIATDDMPTGYSKPMGTASTALETGKITSLDSDGFTLSAHDEVNKTGETYYWIAFKEEGDLIVGTYEGDGTNEDVNIAFRPEMVWIWGDESVYNGDANFWIKSNGGGSNLFRNGSRNANVLVDDPSGFQTQNGAGSPDIDGTNYYYMAFESGAGTLDVSGWNNGADVDGTAKTALGSSQPDFVITSAYLDLYQPIFRIAAQSGDASLAFDASAEFSNGIQSFTATGFTIGTDDRAQYAWQDMDYMAMAGGTLNSLPIELLYFSAEVEKGNQVVLEWKTGSEINNEFFYIERSLDGVEFDDIEIINGAGNSQEELTYTTYDFDAPEGIVYYRIRQIDFDGKNEVFKTKSVFISTQNKVEWKHTKVLDGNQIRVYGELQAEYSLKLFNINGSLVYDHKIGLAQSGISSMTIDLPPDLKPGVYLTVLENGKYSNSKKIMIH